LHNNSRRAEQSNTHPYRALLNCEQVHRIYLKELGEIQQLPLGVALMVLTTVEETQAPEKARYLLARTQQQIADPEAGRAIIEMIATIMVYKFTNLSRQEVEAMLGLQLADTRVYREAKEEGREEGRQEGESALILRLLSRRIGEVTPERRSQIQALSINQLEALGEALLDFTQPEDLEEWLRSHLSPL
jgi:predicted transposase/invertase (TIGR01784 family)